MLYYIKPIHKEPDISLHKNYFEGHCEKITINDNYNNLWIKGKYIIKSNSVLPNYAYFLDINTEFGQVLNVPIHFNRNIETVPHTTENRTFYTTDEYEFSFNLNLGQSSQFNDHIKYKMIQFNIVPMLNQNIINDFKVETTTQDIQGLVSDMNKSHDNLDYGYTNFYDLNKGITSINLNAFDETAKTSINLNVLDWEKNKIFRDYLSFNDLTDRLELFDSELKITFLNCSISPLILKNPGQLYSSPTVILGINEYIKYNVRSNTLDRKELDNLSGIFAEDNVAVKLEFKIKFQYKKLIRTINVNHTIKNKLDQDNQLLQKLGFKQEMYTDFTGAYTEVENEKIF